MRKGKEAADTRGPEDEEAIRAVEGDHGQRAEPRLAPVGTSRQLSRRVLSELVDAEGQDEEDEGGSEGAEPKRQ